MTKLCNQTVGKMIFGIRVISKDGAKLKWSTVIFREWIGRLISIIPFNIPYFVVAFTPKKQAIHDFIADTLVIHEGAYDKKEKVHMKKQILQKSCKNRTYSSKIKIMKKEATYNGTSNIYKQSCNFSW